MSKENEEVSRNEINRVMEIGQIKLVMKWLEHHKLPFTKDKIKGYFDETGYIKYYEVSLDKNEMQKNSNEKYPKPECINSGEIIITFKY